MAEAIPVTSPCGEEGCGQRRQSRHRTLTPARSHFRMGRPGPVRQGIALPVMLEGECPRVGLAPHREGNSRPWPPSRQQTCRSTAEALRRLAPSCPATRAVLGFDGFVDEIIAVVDKRYGPDRFDPVESIAAMARKILGAAGESSNYELVVKPRKLGGNGPIMANALASLGPRRDLHRQPRLPRHPPGLPRLRRPGPGHQHRRARPHRRPRIRRRQADARQDPVARRRELGEPRRPGRPGRARRADGRGDPDRDAQLDDAPEDGRDLGAAARGGLPRPPRGPAGPCSSTWPTPRSGPARTSGAPWRRSPGSRSTST